MLNMWPYSLILKLTLGLLIFQCALNAVGTIETFEKWRMELNMEGSGYSRFKSIESTIETFEKWRMERNMEGSGDSRFRSIGSIGSNSRSISCHTCKGANCTTPQSQFCIAGNDYCFIRFDEKNNVSEMGCVSILRAHNLDDILKNKRITICDGDDCNVLEIPTPQRCASCDTKAELNCAIKPSEIRKFKTCNQLPYTHCYTRLTDDGNTERGCLSDLPTNQFLGCLLGDDMNCGLCLGDGCNREIFRKNRYDAYKGYWQGLPLRCHTCVGKKDCAGSKDAAPFCRGSIKQDCMTVFDAAGVVVRRGCEDEIESEYSEWCNTHKDYCFKCKSNECNYVRYRSDHTQCVFCISSKDPLCATRPKSIFSKRYCHGDCMVAMRDGEVVRSCLSDKEVSLRTKCREVRDNSECKYCHGENCNTFVFPKDRLSCHVCTNSKCCSSKPEYCLKYDKNDTCFAKFEKGKLDLMGCVSGQTVTDIEKWRTEERLYECDFNNCNDFNKENGQLPHKIEL